jgi:prepilin-type N-terminal cleavage/methylation domain-containing protein/prepilin-type processing-associated H-X9-DG protein
VGADDSAKQNYFDMNPHKLNGVEGRALVSSRRSGFTLIELIVVIGVIGILAGLLLPALAKARERGRAVKCISNEKQIGLATQLYMDDHDYFPPGRIAGNTQWDLCVGMYAGGKESPFSLEARTALFMCPSVKIRNNGTRLNYSANPNVCKEVKEGGWLVKQSEIARVSEVIIAADSAQYTQDGDSHAILWGAQGSRGKEIYWNDGEERNAGDAIREGADTDGPMDAIDPAGANFRYRHGSGQVNAIFVDGHVEKISKGKVRDRNVYTNY